MSGWVGEACSFGVWFWGWGAKREVERLLLLYSEIPDRRFGGVDGRSGRRSFSSVAGRNREVHLGNFVWCLGTF